MSTLHPTKRVSRRHELREDKVITFYARALDFLENNRMATYGAMGAIVVIVALILGYSYVNTSRDNEAMELMVGAVMRYENGEYQFALDGDLSFMGLIDITEDYGNTPSGNLARFYAADALYRTGALDRALVFFEDYSKDSNYLGASAYAGVATIRELNKDYDAAGDLYMEAASIFIADITSPEYLLSAGRAYEKAENSGDARRAYERIRDDFPDSQQARDIEFFLARVGSDR